MAKKLRRNKAKPSLADDIRAGLQEALKYVRGEKAEVILHRVQPSDRAAREARHKLGLPQRELASFKTEPKAVRRAIAKTNRRRDAHHPLHRRRRLPGEARNLSRRRAPCSKAPILSNL
jgi:hypothetical protein